MTTATAGTVLGLLLGAALAGVVALVLGARLAAARAELAAERRVSADRTRDAARTDASMREAFASLSAETLAVQGERVAGLVAGRVHEAAAGVAAGTRAEEAERHRALDAMLDPVAATLRRLEGALTSAEREREASFAGLRTQVDAVAASARGVAGETRALTTALRAPQVRGRWGEVQLERVVDLAGMVEHCDFDRQPTHAAHGTDSIRPDMVVHLAGGKHVVVDAKVPLAAYLEATDAPDDTARRERMRAHARQMRTHVDTLSGKQYWRHVEGSPEFVVLFVPGEVFLSAALEADPALLEHAFAADVVVATPTTLIALLRTVGHAWRQDTLAREAREIHELGRRLHERLGTMSGHLGKLGKSLESGVRAYNETVASFESRVLVSARHFETLAVTRDQLPSPAQVERRPRVPSDTRRDGHADTPADGAGSTPGAPDPGAAELTTAELTAAAELSGGRPGGRRDVAG